MLSKSLMDDYKGIMRDGLIANPAAFADYTMSDTDNLEPIYNAFVKLFRWVQADVIGIPEWECFDQKTIKMTTGSLVAKTVEKWIYAKATNQKTLTFAMRKLGLLDTSSKYYTENQEAYKTCCKGFTDVPTLEAAFIDSQKLELEIKEARKQELIKKQQEFRDKKKQLGFDPVLAANPDLDALVAAELKKERRAKKAQQNSSTAFLDEKNRSILKALKQKRSPLHTFMRWAKFKFTALGQAGVNYFAAVTQDSAAYAALVLGGRCVNERGSEAVCATGADIDLASCYGSALRAFSYPIGLPTVWASQPNQEMPTLRQWLAKNESGLLPNLWTITVKGDLSFCQDLIFSKIVTQEQINRAALGSKKSWEKTNVG